MGKSRIVAVLSLFFAISAPLAAGEKDEREVEKQLKAADRDPAFLLKVNTAVGKGIEWLIEQQEEDGSFDAAYKGVNSSHFPGGPTALALLALLKSGVSRHEETIKKGFDTLRTKPLKKTYTVALTIMALEARYTPQKVEERQKGHTQVAGPRRIKVPRSDLDWMKELALFLIENRTYARVGTVRNNVVTEKKIAWHYPNGPDGKPPSAGSYDTGDHSNTQYAILGLRSAQRSGVMLPKAFWEDVWVNIVDHFIEVQEKTGPKVRRWKILEDKKHGYVSYKTVTSVPDTARGWSYFTNPDAKTAGNTHKEVTGSMTSVGVASLIIGMEGLSLIRSSKLNAARRAGIRKSVNDGLAWLDHNFSVTTNPGHHQGMWKYYYLYGLERAAVLAGVRNLGKHDWYREGAEHLLREQRGGCWGASLHTTCFALLFLTKATIPGRVKITR